VSFNYTDGTPCDLDNTVRGSTVLLYCGLKNSIVSIAEDYSCHYLLKVELNLLCGLPGFKVYEEPSRVITFSPCGKDADGDDESESDGGDSSEPTMDNVADGDSSMVMDDDQSSTSDIPFNNHHHHHHHHHHPFMTPANTNANADNKEIPYVSDVEGDIMNIDSTIVDVKSDDMIRLHDIDESVVDQSINPSAVATDDTPHVATDDTPHVASDDTHHVASDDTHHVASDDTHHVASDDRHIDNVSHSHGGNGDDDERNISQEGNVFADEFPMTAEDHHVTNEASTDDSDEGHYEDIQTTDGIDDSDVGHYEDIQTTDGTDDSDVGLYEDIQSTDGTDDSDEDYEDIQTTDGVSTSFIEEHDGYDTDGSSDDDSTDELIVDERGEIDDDARSDVHHQDTEHNHNAQHIDINMLQQQLNDALDLGPEAKQLDPEMLQQLKDIISKSVEMQLDIDSVNAQMLKSVEEQLLRDNDSVGNYAFNDDGDNNDEDNDDDDGSTASSFPEQKSSLLEKILDVNITLPVEGGEPQTVHLQIVAEMMVDDLPIDAAATDAVVIEEDGDEIDRFYDDIIGDGSAGTDSLQEFGDNIEEEGTDDEEEEEEEKDHYE